MQFSAREDIETPIDFAFAQLADFQAHERSALRRGAEVQRVDSLSRTGPGMAWDSAFELRGRRRELQIELTSFDPPNGMVISSRSPAMGGQMVVDLVALSRGRTRMSVQIDLEPNTLSARLMVQSLKLARKNLTRRFRGRVAAYAEDIEDRFKAGS